MVSSERTRPRPGTTPAETAARQLVRAFGLLERVMSPYFARYGLSGAQWGVLRNLHRAELEGLAGLRLTDLSERLLIRPPSVTGLVDRLEKAGLVQRNGVLADQRAKHVALTDKGRELLGRMLEMHPEQLGTVMGGLTKAEQTELGSLLEKLGNHMHQLAGAGGI